MVVNSGKWYCGVCGKGVQANKVDSQAVRGSCCDFSLVVDGFGCKSCDGITQYADLPGYLMVDGETYEF